MLTKELGIADCDFASSRISPDRLTRNRHRHYPAYAQRMLDAYRSGAGHTRRELHRLIREIFANEQDCPQRRIDAFCKLLDDAGDYDRGSPRDAAALRRRVFRLAAPQHPLVQKADRLFEHEERSVKKQIAAELGRSWEEIDADLFADITEFHRLRKFTGFDSGEALLARYNVAQIQVALFDAVAMSIWATEDFKTILRYAKLSGLMHTIVRKPDCSYHIRLDGPAALLRQTRRYGVAMAKFLPALIACRGWRMHAMIRKGRKGWNLGLDLSADDGLTSHLPAPETFDSQVEAVFAEKWGPEKRDGWQLVREGEVLHQRQKVFVPDFAFRHDDGRTVLMEIVGFWTSEYLQAKMDTLSAFPDQRIVLAVAESVYQNMPNLPQTTIVYKSTLHLKDVLERLNLPLV